MNYYLEKAKKIRAKKRLGQNFLIDETIINTIIQSANISEDETIVEIGAGYGFVTENVAQKAGKVIALELDEDAITELQKLPFSNIEIIHKDILKTDFSELVNNPVKIVANIPYYITSPILAHLLGEINQADWKNRTLIKEITLMVQYEVAKRIVANEKSPSKDYGLLSILVNYWCETEIISKVPAKCFYPAPKVDSALVKLTLRNEPIVKSDNPSLLRKVAQAAFNKRRKTIKNALVMNGFEADKVMAALDACGIDPGIRGEKLSIEDFNKLSGYLR